MDGRKGIRMMDGLDGWIDGWIFSTKVFDPLPHHHRWFPFEAFKPVLPTNVHV